jgi:hypothetical protein
MAPTRNIADAAALALVGRYLMLPLAPDHGSVDPQHSTITRGWF